jgi:hypothetical protein
MFPIRNYLKERDALSPLLFSIALENVIRRVQINRDALKLNGTREFLVYANDNILGGSVHVIKKNTDALVAASKEIGLEVHADKSKYIVRSRDQNAGRSYKIKTDNSSFECVEHFNYLGTNYRNTVVVRKKLRADLSQGCLLSFAVESFVFQFAIKKCKDEDIQNL